MEYYIAYTKIPDFAKMHGFVLEFGHYTTKDKSADYLSENKVLTEININSYILVKFENDIYVCIVKTDCAADTNKLNNILNVAKKFSEILFIAPAGDNTKIRSLAAEHLPKINLINLPAFIANPMANCFSPASVEKIDYTDEEIIHVEKKNLMEINFHDPICAWFRFKPDDVLRILNRSFVSGFVTQYRFVKFIAK